MPIIFLECISAYHLKWSDVFNKSIIISVTSTNKVKLINVRIHKPLDFIRLSLGLIGGDKSLPTSGEHYHLSLFEGALYKSVSLFPQ